MFAEEAIVLVGGLGTRLRAVVQDVPKPLAPVAGRPFLAWVLDGLAESGVRRVILAAGYLAGTLQSSIGDRWGRLQIDYSIESQPLGTGGAVRLACSHLHGTAAFVLNGDTFLRVDLRALELATRRSDGVVGVALAHVPDTARYGAVRCNGARIEAFTEKGLAGPGYINAGTYFLSEEAIRTLPTQFPSSFESDVLVPLAARGALTAYTETEGFIDIGVPEDYARAQQVFAPQ